MRESARKSPLGNAREQGAAQSRGPQNRANDAGFLRPSLLLTSPHNQLGLQRLVGNQSANRLRRRLAGLTGDPDRSRAISRHSDAALQEQIEQAKQEEGQQGGSIQRKIAVPSGNTIQRHLVPKSAQAADFAGVPTASMAEKLRAEIAGRASQSRNAILQWLEGQKIDESLKEQKRKQIKKLEWKTSLQRLGGVAAKVDGATGTVQLFTRQPDYFDQAGEVDTDFVQVTMIHEAFHALSANHTGFQNDQLFPEIRESLDEAFTDKYAAEAFHLAFGAQAKYTSNYWLPGTDRWTGDLAEVVEQITNLSRDDIITSYLQNPAVVTQGYVTNLLTVQDAWATLKGRNRPNSEAAAKQEVTQAVEQAKQKNLAPPAVGPGAPAPHGAVAPAAAGPAAAALAPAPVAAIDPQLKAIYDFMATLPTNRGMPKTLAVKPQLQTMVTDYNQNRAEKEHIQVADLSTMYMKWKESVTVTPVNEGHLKTAAETLGLPTSDHSGINLIIPTPKSTLGDLVSSVPLPQRTTAASAEFSQSTLGAVMGEGGGDQSRNAADLLDAMGGGGYEATTATIFLHPKHNNNLPHYVHEVGHYVQHGEQGYFQGAKGDDQRPLKLTTVLDYHNIIKNENPLHLSEEAKKGKQGDKRHIRYKYVGSEKDVMASVEEIEAKGAGLPLSAEILEELKQRPYSTDVDRSMLDEMFMLMIGDRETYPADVRAAIFTNLGAEWDIEAKKNP